MKRKWRYIDESNVSASYGLGADEFIMTTCSTPILRLYTYKNYSVLAGRFQDLRAEIDIAKCESIGYDYNRRLTGGGAIIMGEDQLGLCLAAPANYFSWKHVRELYHMLALPVIESLRSFGIDACFRAKNDLEVNGKKIAGLGIHLDALGNFHFHTSLLLDLDIRNMLSVLNIPVQKLDDKRMINSVDQRMTTVRKETGKQITLTELKASIKNSFQLHSQIEWNEIPFSNSEKEGIKKIEEERYMNSDWIFQRSAQEDMDGMSLKKLKPDCLGLTLH
ncbi:MAG: lipoate--protein ligase family protein [Flammeovirgaceae bacterium]|nr:lipoate--protein ligase family protein [Flammeovirgaceae bacterium]